MINEYTLVETNFLFRNKEKMTDLGFNRSRIMVVTWYLYQWF